jgi:hypothetical protein
VDFDLGALLELCEFVRVKLIGKREVELHERVRLRKDGYPLLICESLDSELQRQTARSVAAIQ